MQATPFPLRPSLRTANRPTKVSHCGHLPTTFSSYPLSAWRQSTPACWWCPARWWQHRVSNHSGTPPRARPCTSAFTESTTHAMVTTGIDTLQPALSRLRPLLSDGLISSCPPCCCTLISLSTLSPSSSTSSSCGDENHLVSSVT